MDKLQNSKHFRNIRRKTGNWFYKVHCSVKLIYSCSKFFLYPAPGSFSILLQVPSLFCSRFLLFPAPGSFSTLLLQFSNSHNPSLVVKHITHYTTYVFCITHRKYPVWQLLISESMPYICWYFCYKRITAWLGSNWSM